MGTSLASGRRWASLPCALILSAALPSCTSSRMASTMPSGEPSTQASTQPTMTVSQEMGMTSPAVHYPYPYHTPTVAEITDVLQRIHHRLSTAATPRFIDRRTKAPITDLSKPVIGLIIDPGPEGKFGAVSYPMGVIYNGMLGAAEATGDPRYSKFDTDWFDLIAKSIPEFAKWPNQTLAPPVPPSPTTGEDMSTGDSTTMRSDMATTEMADANGGYGRGRGGGPGQRVLNPMRALLAPNSLDDCGAMCSAMVKARLAKLGPDLQPVIDRAINFVSTKQFRLPDGTLARHRPTPETIWADDMYMGVVLLSQAGHMTGDKKYFDDAAKQVLQIGGHLWVPEKKLMTHGWNTVNPDDRPTYFWGRANGWCMMAMAELLTVLPEDHPDRPAVLKQFRAMAQGLVSLQAGDGLWHQMLDRPDSYTETSCSGMFVFAMARGVNRGWLDASAYGPAAIAGWASLATRVDKTGHVSGTCIGTGIADDYSYYYNRPEIDDIHGYGPVLLAGAEVIHLMRDTRFSIARNNDGRNPIVLTPRTGRNRRGGRSTTQATTQSAVTQPDR